MGSDVHMANARYHGTCKCGANIIPGDSVARIPWKTKIGPTIWRTVCRMCARVAAAREADTTERSKGAYAAAARAPKDG